MTPSESSPAGCGEKSILNSSVDLSIQAEHAQNIKCECSHLRQQLATAERTIAEATEHCQAVDEENFHLKRRAESAERTCDELKAKCGELFAREQVLRDEMVRARTADQITNRSG